MVGVCVRGKVVYAWSWCSVGILRWSVVVVMG